MRNTLITSLALFLLSVVNGQLPKFGNCPEVTLEKNFEPAKYFTGKYYEQKRFWNIFETGAKCVHAEYSVNEDGTVRVENSGFRNGRFDQVGEAYCDKNSTSSCYVTFFPGTPAGSYNVLAADPDKFGLVYSCKQLVPGVLNTQYAWILTREKDISAEEMNKYLEIFKSNGVDITSFMDIAQDCEDN